MEKITFEPLLELLKQNADSLNQSVKATLSANPAFKTGEISGWVHRVIEPLFKAFHSDNTAKNQRIFDLLWRDMLKALNRRETLENPDGSANCRRLPAIKPALFSKDLAAMLKALSSAHSKVYRHSPQAADQWLAIMQKVIAAAENSEEVLAAGRLAAWKCGMAHLYSLLKDSTTLSPAVLSAVFANSPGTPESLLQRWPHKNPQPLAVGAFTGSGGVFVRPPKLCQLGSQIFASDGTVCTALFADCHGSALCECSETFIEALEFSLIPIDSVTESVRKILSQYSDLTSWVCHEQTIYLTTASSHSIFIFGAVDE